AGNFSSPDGTTDDPLGGHTVWQVVFIAFLTGILALVTIIGNILVIVSFKVNKQLKTVNNYFLLSLACADLIIGVISMNLFTTYIIMNRWALGNLACDLWLAIDCVASNASVMNLLVISFDRYFSITRPLTYRAKRTTKRAGVMIGLAWVISFVLWAPAILFWQYFVGKRTVPPGECFIQFLSEPTITFGTAIAGFYMPVTIMTILYWRIYKETEKRTKELAGLQASGTEAETENFVHPAKRFALKTRSQITKRKRMSLVKEKKAAQTLSAILLAFIITWTPYNIMVLVNTFCDSCIPKTFWNLGYWLCYINSTVNPVCYALCNKTFRTTFKMLLLCQCDKKKRRKQQYQQRQSVIFHKRAPEQALGGSGGGGSGGSSSGGGGSGGGGSGGSSSGGVFTLEDFVGDWEQTAAYNLDQVLEQGGVSSLLQNLAVSVTPIQRIVRSGENALKIDIHVIIPYEGLSADQMAQIEEVFKVVYPVDDHHFKVILPYGTLVIDGVTPNMLNYFGRPYEGIAVFDGKKITVTGTLWNGNKIIDERLITPDGSMLFRVTINSGGSGGHHHHHHHHHH
uniref:Muscarinic acetylcholine receptor M3 n=2 Tax=Homo sapiens TaxID=9606 RepID=UPI0022656FA4|nr:Chain A, Muscarinic acetylcholine receptor M3 [Homo sapiens]